MSYAPGRSAASAMVFMGAGMRLFCGMAIGYSAAYNASWMCPLIALLLCAPLALTMHFAGRLGNDSPWKNLAKHSPNALTNGIAALFVLMLVYDCASFVRLTASTANFVALNDVSLAWLVLPLAIVLFVVMQLGPDAEGNSARIWLLMLPLLLAIVFAVQFESYNPSWILPVLGGGLPALAQGGLLCGGWLGLLLLPWMTAVPDRKKNKPLRLVLLSAAVSAILLIGLCMLSPTLIETNLSEMERTEIIMSNNRVSHVLQMFLTMIWFGSLLHLISIEAVTAAVFVRDRLPKLPGWLVSVGCSLSIALLSTSDLLRGAIERRIYPLFFIAIGGVCVLMMVIAIFKSGGKENAAV